jgi:hypothetical protein
MQARPRAFFHDRYYYNSRKTIFAPVVLGFMRALYLRLANAFHAFAILTVAPPRKPDGSAVAPQGGRQGCSTWMSGTRA